MNPDGQWTERAAPSVSIVMPMFNSAEFLESTVDSVRAQRRADWQLVLYDDGSTDGTAAISRHLAEIDPRITTATGRHLGVGVARNDGLRRTDPRSRYVVFLDSDDTWTADALEVLVEALEANPGCPAAHGLARGTDLSGQIIEGDDLEEQMRERTVWVAGGQVPVDDPSRTPFAAMIIKNWVVTPGTSIIRREALTRIGDFEPSTSPADDWDLNVRLARLGDLAFVDRVVLNWRRHPDSLANTSKRWRIACLRVRVRAIEDPGNSAEQRRLALDLLASDCRAWRAAAIDAIRARSPRRLVAELVFVVLGHVHLIRLRLRRR
jgi:glycosyltransferase involved in cell wall biosynthesis